VTGLVAACNAIANRPAAATTAIRRIINNFLP
jgi:hypothetical protein